MTKEERAQELRGKIIEIQRRHINTNIWAEENADQILTLIKSVCYLKAERELPEPETPDARLIRFEFQLAEKKGYKRAQQDMLTPDPEGRVWASVWKEW